MITVLIIVGVLVILGISIVIWVLIEKLKPTANNLEKFLGLTLLFSLALFILILMGHPTPYFKDIDPFVEPCYSPISYKDSFGLITIHLLSIISLVILYFKEYLLPPLQITTFILILCLGILANLQFIYQVSSHDTSRIHLWNNGDNAGLYLSIYPFVLIVCSIGVLLKMIKNKSKLNSNKSYKNKYLNWLNNKLKNSYNLPLLSLLLTAPILLLILLILVIFGQDVESLNRVYSETATWKLSQHLHPPTVDDRHGHYLCTVAAHGTPKIVKPIGIGNRNGNIIIVNRQLQIANAFEFLIEEINPRIHQVIRISYDKYGINLAKRVNNENLSNLTYVLMKPIELVFLIILYSWYIKPEEIIKNQYKYTT